MRIIWDNTHKYSHEDWEQSSKCPVVESHHQHFLWRQRQKNPVSFSVSWRTNWNQLAGIRVWPASMVEIPGADCFLPGHPIHSPLLISSYFISLLSVLFTYHCAFLKYSPLQAPLQLRVTLWSIFGQWHKSRINCGISEKAIDFMMKSKQTKLTEIISSSITTHGTAWNTATIDREGAALLQPWGRRLPVKSDEAKVISCSSAKLPSSGVTCPSY